jgi:hypothetical protein
MDPWASTNQGLANLTSTLGTLAQFKRQDRLDAEQAQDHAKARTLADLQLKTEQQKFDDKAALRTELANVQGKYLYPEPQGVGPMQPEKAQTLSDLGPVQQPASTMDRMKVASNLASQGNTAAQAALPQLAQVIDLDDKLAQLQMEVEQGGGDRNEFLKKKAQFEQGKEMMKTLAPMAANPATRKMAEKQLEWYKQQQPDNPLLQGMAVDDFAVKNDGLVVALKDPNTGTVIGYNVLDPYTNKTTFHEAPKAEAPAYKDRTRPEGTGTVFEESLDGGKTWKPVSRGTKPKGGGHGDDTGGGDDVQAWAKAITEGRANLQDVPSRGTIRSQVVKLIEKGGGTDYAANKADNAAFASSISNQQKQIGAMGSFVKNMDAQIGRVDQLAKELQTFDTRLLNIPLRAVRGRIVGSPQQAKYDMYLAEIESEIGKLATGSAGSVAELSIGAQEKWAKIHDRNLSIKDMQSLLKETRHAGQLRMKSVEDQLKETRQQMRNRGGAAGGMSAGASFIGSQIEAYKGAKLDDDTSQKRIYSKMKQRGWSDQQIGAAWKEYKGQ